MLVLVADAVAVFYIVANTVAIVGHAVGDGIFVDVANVVGIIGGGVITGDVVAVVFIVQQNNLNKLLQELVHVP